MLSFANPFFLWGLTALTVPVALHLMNRAVPVRQHFPSIRFIRRARLPREGRRRLRDLLLLLLRLALLAAIVLFFAQPQWRSEAEAAIPLSADRGEVVIMIDMSSSMGGWGSVDAAKQAAAQIVETRNNDHLGLVAFSDRIMFSAAPAADTAVLKRKLNEMQPEPVAGDPAAALREAISLFTAKAPRQLFLISDFQRSDWEFSLLPEVPADINIEFIPVSPERDKNAGIVGVTVNRLSTETLRILAEVRNFGLEATEQVVSLQMGAQVHSNELHLPPLAVQKTAFTVQNAEISKAQVRLQPDAYAADNSWHFWAGALPPVKLLAVVPLEQEAQKQEELFFIRKALQVRDESHPTEFELEIVEPEFLFALNLDAVQGLLLLGAGGYFHQPEWELVRSYLESGKLVLVTPGHSPGHMIRSLRANDLLRAEYHGVTGEYSRSYEGYGLGWIRPGSTLAQLFDNPSSTDLFAFPIHRYVNIKLYESAQQYPLLRMIDEAPALVTANVGGGQLFLSTFAFTSTWSDLPMTGSFLPLLRHILEQAIPSQHGVRQIECGQTLSIAADLLQIEQGTQHEFDTRTPGVLLLDKTPVEVNVPRRESLLETVNLLDLSEALSKDRAELQTAGLSLQGLPGTTAGSTIELWPWLAVAAALLFICDLFLGGWLDRRELRQRIQ